MTLTQIATLSRLVGFAKSASNGLPITDAWRAELFRLACEAEPVVEDILLDSDLDSDRQQLDALFAGFKEIYKP